MNHTCAIANNKHEGSVPLFDGEEYACIPCLVKIAQTRLLRRRRQNPTMEMIGARTIQRIAADNDSPRLPWPLKG